MTADGAGVMTIMRAVGVIEDDRLALAGLLCRGWCDRLGQGTYQTARQEADRRIKLKISKDSQGRPPSHALERAHDG